MTAERSTLAVSVSPVALAQAARERAWRAGDGTTLHLLELFEQMQRRRTRPLAQRRNHPTVEPTAR